MSDTIKYLTWINSIIIIHILRKKTVAQWFDHSQGTGTGDWEFMYV